MQIPCPFCGSRDLREFTYFGDASRGIPTLKADFDTWATYVWVRKNPRGRLSEHWQHTHGCRQFLQISRDTGTHEIFDVRLAGAHSEERQQ